MAQGGKREGSGRPKGSRNKKTIAQTEAIEKAGITPLEYILAVLRDETQEQSVRLDAAHKAAPYVHAKLATGTVNVNGNVAHQVTRIIIEEADGDSDDQAAT
ncbi:hypothetical protein UFOVP317_39 [uncultured Caudovirales phage]|uniref:Uncharacterized protein n=1 Tax=uncultured Caudovirales phage TaxID=2100421 RepID=A0A6J5LS98_9CAUD|nr:hypothetical protein UFOVP317_39 [uncultured Caudovirales phage]